MRGNVVDLAIGVIIGGAFGGIVNSLVSDVFTPKLKLTGYSQNEEIAGAEITKGVSK